MQLQQSNHSPSKSRISSLKTAGRRNTGINSSNPASTALQPAKQHTYGSTQRPVIVEATSSQANLKYSAVVTTVPPEHAPLSSSIANGNTAEANQQNTLQE
ncbi:hypothetical protein Peur_041580 [Populus x canadensis]